MLRRPKRHKMFLVKKVHIKKVDETTGDVIDELEFDDAMPNPDFFEGSTNKKIRNGE